MRVLIVHPHLTYLGGAELVVVKLSENLAKFGIDNSILTLSLSKEINNKYSYLNFILPTKQYPCKSKSVNLFRSLRTIKETQILSSLIKRYAKDFDVVNLHNFPATWAFALSGLKKPCVWYCNEVPNIWHNPHPSLELRMIYRLGSILDKWIIRKICVADPINAEKVNKTYKIIHKVMPYGIDVDFFEIVSENERQEIIKKYNLEGKFILIQVGLITPQKNQLASIQAVKDLVNDIPDVKLVLVGRPIGSLYIEEIKRYIQEENLEEYIIFTGHLSREEIKILYKISHIGLFPVKEQGGWLSPFEAICCEMPVIVSSTMGASTLIKEYQLGAVTDNLTETIREIINNYSFYKERAKQAKQWVKRNLSWDNFAKNLSSMFRDILERRVYCDKKN